MYSMGRNISRVITVLCRCFSPLLLTALSSTLVHAEHVHVAVAANFLQPLQALKDAFEDSTGHSVLVSSGSTGQLYNQIVRGAPYHVFMAADRRRPTLLTEKGHAVAETQFTYAFGRLALYSNRDRPHVGRAVLEEQAFSRLAIANPSLAPYGTATIEVLTALKVMPEGERKLVFGANIAQTFQYVETGNVDYGLVALAQVENKPYGQIWPIPEQLHSPIAQDAVLLSHGKNSTAAHAFMAYLKLPEVQQTIKNYGYGIKEQSD